MKFLVNFLTFHLKFLKFCGFFPYEIELNSHSKSHKKYSLIFNVIASIFLAAARISCAGFYLDLWEDHTRITLMTTNCELTVNFLAFFVIAFTSLFTSKKQIQVFNDINSIELKLISLKHSKLRLTKFYGNSKKNSIICFILLFVFYFLAASYFTIVYCFQVKNFTVFILIQIDNFGYFFLSIYFTVLLTVIYYILLLSSEFVEILNFNLLSISRKEDLVDLIKVFNDIVNFIIEFMNIFGVFIVSSDLFCSLNLSFQFYFIYIGLFNNNEINDFSYGNLLWYIMILFTLYRLGNVCTQLNISCQKFIKTLSQRENRILSDQILLNFVCENFDISTFSGFISTDESFGFKVNKY